jgi:hypothetical protein
MEDERQRRIQDRFSRLEKQDGLRSAGRIQEDQNQDQFSRLRHDVKRVGIEIERSLHTKHIESTLTSETKI